MAALLCLTFLTLLNSNNTSSKWINKLWNWSLEFWTWDAGLQLWLRLRASRRGAIYRQCSSRPANQVVGPTSPHCGQMASPSSRYFLASHLSKNGWSSLEIWWRHDLSGDGGGNGGDGWCLSGPSMFPVGPSCMYFYHIHTYIYAMQKYFMILWNIRRWMNGIC